MPLFSREKSSLKGRWRLETVQDMRSSSSNPVSCSETSIKIYGSKEEIRARKSPETVDAPGFAPDASIPVILYGPSDRIRTCGILLPNLSGKLFPLVYSGFRRFLICFTYSLTLLSPLFPSVPEPYVVIYVVKNASRPVSGEDSPVPGGKRFVFQTVCIVTLSRVLCKWFSGRIAAQRLSRYRQRNTRMPYSLKIKLASPQ